MKIIVLKGLPWSGKSTWTRSQDIPSISKDNIRELLYNWIYSKKNEQEVIDFSDELIKALLLEWSDVIVDDTNLNPIHTDRMRQIADEYNAEVEIKEFTTDIETCIERDKDREKSVGEKVIRRMAKQWNYPPKQKEFEAIATFSNDKKDAVVFDIDGTIAENIGRSPYDMTRVWEDKPYEDIVEMVRIMHKAGYTIIFVSGRDDSCEKDTAGWLIHCARVPRWFFLRMRKEWDKRKDSIIKYEIAKDLNEQYNIRYVFDDRDQVVSMWREAGFRCLQVQEGNF